MKNKITSGQNKKALLASGISAILTLATLATLMFILKFGPFGRWTFAIDDGASQMLDFYAYLKNVLMGKDDLIYSFSKALGGSMLGVFAYYLASPLNILVVFFEETELITLFNTIVVLKLSLASGAMSFYIYKRFSNESSSSKWLTALSVLYGFAYSMSFWAIRTAYLPMWLDGFILLPLQLYGLYIIRKEDTIGAFVVTLTCSLLFNWYTAWTNLIFLVFWFVVEGLIDPGNKEKLRKSLRQFILSILLAFLISAIFLLPVFFSMQNGTRGGMDFGLLADLSFKASPLSVLNTATFQHHLDYWMILVAILVLFAPGVSKRVKLACAISLSCSLIAVSWSPIMILFAIFRVPCGTNVRYAYVCYIPVYFFSCFLLCKIKSESKKTKAAKMLGLVLFFLCTIQGRKELLAHYVEHEESAALQDWTMMVEETKKILGTIKSYDAEQNEPDRFYRISRSLNIDPKIVNRNLYRNEALAHTYNSLSHYSSTPDESTLNLLGNLGYNVQEETVPIVNTSILPVDSLLATKYITTTQRIPGLKKISGNVYENPFALPVALTYQPETIEPPTDDNPFQYSEYLYSLLVGEPVHFYRELEYTSDYARNETGDISSKTLTVQLPTDLESYVLYLNTDYFTYNQKEKRPLQTDKIACTGESFIRSDTGQDFQDRLFSAETFLVEYGEKDTVTLSGIGCNRYIKMSFYALDLERFDEVVRRIKDNSKRVGTLVETGRIELNVATDAENENVLLSVPYDKGWTLMLNGKKRRTQAFEGSLITIPLEKGKNQIILEYHQKGIVLGILLTIVGNIAFATIVTRQNLKKKLDGYVSHYLLNMYNRI